jgi:hypothetical protein
VTKQWKTEKYIYIMKEKPVGSTTTVRNSENNE